MRCVTSKRIRCDSLRLSLSIISELSFPPGRNQLKEGPAQMRTLLSDVKYGVRSAVKDWRFAGMVVLTLAICIGANTALFTIVNSVLLEPLPVADADALVLMSNEYPKAGVGESTFSGPADYYE